MGDKKKYVIGYDLGGTKLLAALFDQRFQLLAEIKTKTKPQKGERYFRKILKECFEHLLHEAEVSRSEVVGLGIGCPGLVDEKRGVVLTSPNISFIKNLRLAALIQRDCGVPAIIGNDVKTGLFGEYTFGAAKGYSHVAGIFIGTGIGGAFLLNGKMYLGSSGAAGEIGHVLVDPEGPLCGCGRRGCFEAVCSRLAVATEAAALVARQQAPHLHRLAGTDVLEIRSGQLAKAIRAGDRAIEALVRRKAIVVGTVMADIVNLLNPELIVLGGGYVEAMPKLVVQTATRAMRERAMPSLAHSVKVTAARLGDHAIVLGAAKRAWDRFARQEIDGKLTKDAMAAGRNKRG